MATITDNFNRADSTTSLGSSSEGWSWTAVGGTWGINTNRAYLVATGGSNSARAESDLSSTDHYAQMVLGVAAQIGPCVRFAAGAATFYHARRAGSTSIGLLRFNAGSATTLGTLTVAALGIGDTLKLSVTGTGATVTLEAFINGVSAGTFGDTDANRITSGTRCGLRAAAAGTGNSPMDDFQAADLGVVVRRRKQRIMLMGCS